MSEHVNPKRAWLIAILLSLFMLVNFIDKIAIGMVAVPMMTDLGLSPTEFGVVASSFFWLFSISGVVGGFIANRVSTRWLLLAMAVVWSAVQLPIVVSSSLMVIIVARVLLGVAEGPSWPIAVHACYKWFPNDKRNLPVSVIGQGATVGLLFAGFIMPMVTAHWGWRANFVGLCLVGIAWTVLWLVLGAEGPLGNRPKASDAAAKSSGHRVSYARLLTDTTILSNFVLHFVAYWGLALTLTWLPAFLQKGLQYDAVTAGRLFALVVVVGTPINVGLSWWSQRLLANGASSRTARAQFSSAFLILAGLLFGALLVIDLNPLAKVLIVAVATGLTPIIYSLGPAMLAEVTPESQRSGILALDNSIASVAGFLAPVATGRLVEGASGSTTIGYEQGFAVSGVLLIVGGLVGLIWTDPEKSALKLRELDVPQSGTSRQAA